MIEEEWKIVYLIPINKFMMIDIIVKYEKLNQSLFLLDFNIILHKIYTNMFNRIKSNVESCDFKRL